jgi:hypothetical protein
VNAFLVFPNTQNESETGELLVIVNWREKWLLFLARAKPTKPILGCEK